MQKRKMQHQKDQKTENEGLQMQDQISGGESGKKGGGTVTLKVVDHKMQDQGDRLSDALPDLLMEQGFHYFLK